MSHPRLFTKVVWYLLGLTLPVCAAPCAQNSVEPNSYEEFTRRLPNGLVDVAALDLPEQFVSRVAGRSLRSTFRRQHRQVPDFSSPSTTRTAEGPIHSASAPGIQVRTGHISDTVLDRWRKFAIEVPPLRGFRAPVPPWQHDPWPFRPPTGDHHSRYKTAATYVAQNLARMGLIRTTMSLMQQFDLPWLLDAQLDQSQLRTVGIPTDLLACFDVNDCPIEFALINWLQTGGDPQTIERVVREATFTYSASCPGFEVSVDDGSERIGVIRMQLPIDGFQAGPGDGSTLDVFRQLANRGAPEQLLASVHARNLAGVIDEIGRWTIKTPERITLVSAPAPFTRWAQDNAKPGTAPLLGHPENRRLVTLLPRYASRNEQITKFLPGDSLVFDVLGSVVGRCVASPLLFQGGNMLVFATPATGQRIMLLGEAEVYRNHALGLTHEQVLTAFKIEFGVDQVVIIPAITFHVDMELTIRRVGDELVACIADEIQASRIIIAESIEAFVRRGLVQAQEADRIRALLQTDDFGRAARALREMNSKLGEGTYRLSTRTVATLAQSPLESATMNGQRYLLAVDLVTAAAIHSKQYDEPSIMPSERAYLESLHRRSTARSDLGHQLSELGLRVHRVPAFGDEEIGINYINVVHLDDAMLLPVLGGFFEPLDQAAALAFRKAVGREVRIEPIASAAAQRAYGGVHCMVSLYPAIR